MRELPSLLYEFYLAFDHRMGDYNNSYLDKSSYFHYSTKSVLGENFIKKTMR